MGTGTGTAFQRVMRHHKQPNDGVIEADVVSSIIAVIANFKNEQETIMRKLASIRRVADIQPIEGADKISLL